ncbi:gag-pol polyprotein [Trichonephila clavipes]|nr:gag-pol polyprotein [Trichonephila clavipes]
MPPHIQTVLSVSSEPLDTLAIIADKVSEVVGASSTICAAATVPPPSQSSSCSAQPTMDSLARQIQGYRKSGQKFLIDSGSEICVIPNSPTMNKSPQSNFSLFAANNTKIPAYGMVRKELNLGLRRPFIWTFIIADVSSPIIGADFLKHFNLLIDLKKKG